MGNTHTAPQVEDTILTSASETDSEAIVAFNFGGSTGVILILVLALVLTFFMYQFCKCCMPGRCRQQQRPTNDNQTVNTALIQLALAIGQNQSQQQQHLQVQEHHQQQVPRVTPGHNCPTVNQALLTRLGKAAGTSGEVQGVRRLQWRPEEPEGGDMPGSGPGSNQEDEVPNGPPGVPEITEQDLLQDPVLVQALWSIINNTH